VKLYANNSVLEQTHMVKSSLLTSLKIAEIELCMRVASMVVVAVASQMKKPHESQGLPNVNDSIWDPNDDQDVQISKAPSKGRRYCFAAAIQGPDLVWYQARFGYFAHRREITPVITIRCFMVKTLLNGG
jgi:hypothetical protein